MHWSTKTPVYGLVSAGVAVTAFAAGASAADLAGNPRTYERAPAAAAPPYGAHYWTGLYAGIQAGYGWTETHATSLWGQLNGPQETFTWIGGFGLVLTLWRRRRGAGHQQRKSRKLRTSRGSIAPAPAPRQWRCQAGASLA